MNPKPFAASGRTPTATWVRLLLAVLCAATAFGGSFTCKSSNDDNEVTVHTHLQRQPLPPPVE